jgi:hypothetical protein
MKFWPVAVLGITLALLSISSNRDGTYGMGGCAGGSIRWHQDGT